jgi:hypothetical protein
VFAPFGRAAPPSTAASGTSIERLSTPVPPVKRMRLPTPWQYAGSDEATLVLTRQTVTTGTVSPWKAMPRAVFSRVWRSAISAAMSVMLDCVSTKSGTS